MQTKSSLNVNTGEHYKAPEDNQPAKESVIAGAPVHSMKKDLEMINNPSAVHQESPSLPTPSYSSYSSPLKVSPFLEKSSLTPAPAASQKKFENMAEPSDNEKPLKQEAEEISGQNTLKKVFVFSIIFLSLVALGIGSYYFWLVRGNNSEPLAEEAPAEETPSPAAIVEPEVKIEIPKENTIVLNLENSTSATIKTEIKNQIEKLSKDSLSKPVELKLRDPQNNPILFSSFAKKSGMTFAQNLSANLGESFSLFAFNDGPNLGIGLIVESKNDALLTQGLLRREPSLPKDLDVLLLTAPPATVKKVSFSNFTYKNITLRYFNLISPEKLSIDYVVAKNKLIIGTTKKTQLALYDWLLLNPNI